MESWSEIQAEIWVDVQLEPVGGPNGDQVDAAVGVLNGSPVSSRSPAKRANRPDNKYMHVKRICLLRERLDAKKTSISGKPKKNEQLLVMSTGMLDMRRHTAVKNTARSVCN
mmetsp:Transcript_55736/g.99254  ORF Transcript_55736/g.99254 Transcript_55736/m.99254 type:complete len:112 (-) Transcript_55736:1549-1884(-)